MKKFSTYISAGLLLVVVSLPFSAYAETANTEIQSKMQAIMAQIKVLEEQLNTLRKQAEQQNGGTSTSTPPLCPQIARNLGVGSRGDDVKNLQSFLSTDKTVYTGGATGYFGNETAKGVMKFQEKNGIAPSGTGFVGSMTREFLGKRCPPPPLPPQGQRPLAGIVSSNNGVILSFALKNSESVSVTMNEKTVFLKWTSTTTPPTNGFSGDIAVGSFVIVEASKEASTTLPIARIIRIGFPTSTINEVKPLPPPFPKDGEKRPLPGTTTPPLPPRPPEGTQNGAVR